MPEPQGLFGRVRSLGRRFLDTGPVGDTARPRSRRVRFLSRYLLVTVSGMILFGFVNLVEGRVANGAVELGFGLFGTVLLLALRLAPDRVELIQFLTLADAIAIMVFLLLRGGVAGTGILWWFCLPSGFFFLAGGRRGWVWVGATLGALVSMVALDWLGWVSLFYSRIYLRQFVAVYLAVCLTIYLYEIIREQQEALVERQAERVRETNERLVQEAAERERMHEALAAAKADAERANLAKSEFLSRMSHELRTPMNAILGFSQLMESDDREPLGPAQRESVGQILAAGRHLLGLINEVLDLARIEAGRLPIAVAPVALAPLVAECLALARPLAETRDITLRDSAAGRPDLWVAADPHRLRQVLLNLLSNAVKYNRAGGLVIVEAAPGGAGAVTLAVTDTGEGIPAEQQAHVFEPFQRLGADRTSVEGTGIGLTIARRLMEAMGGTIGLTSAPGLGTSFTLTLPRAEKPAQEERGAPEPAAESPAGGAGAILYVEDDLANLTLVRHVLARRPGVRLLHTAHGEEGIAMAASLRPRLVLLDLHLPDIRGEEVLKRLREDPQTRGIPVVIVSASAMPHDCDRLLAAGAERYLTKPFDVPLFLETVDAYLHRPGENGGEGGTP